MPAASTPKLISIVSLFVMTELVFAHTAAAFFILHCAILGFALARWMPAFAAHDALRSNISLQWFFSICMGMAINIAMLFILGIGGILHATAVALTACVLLLAAALSHVAARRFAAPRGARPFRQAQPALRWSGALELTALTALFILTVVSAFHAPGHWDDTMYQLPIARFYLQQEGIALAEYLRFPLFPQNMNLLLALGLMMGGTITAQVFANLPLFISAIGLTGASRWMTDSPALGILASIALFWLPPVQEILGYAYIDNGVGLFCWSAALALALWVAQNQQDQASGGKTDITWPMIAGMLAGIGAGTKYFGGVFAFILGASLVLFCLLRQRPVAWRVPISFSLAVLLWGTWWYVRSALISGDPLHPAGGNLFGFFLWNAEDLVEQKLEQATYGVGHNPLRMGAALIKAGVAIWLLAFAGLFFPRTPAHIRFLQSVFLLYVAFWFFVTQVPRYLAPVYAVGTLLSVLCLLQAWRTIPWVASRSRPLQAALLTVFATLLAIYTTLHQAQHFLHQAAPQYQDELSSRSGYQLYAAANQYITEYGPNVVQLGFENGIFFFEGTVIGDWFGPGRYRAMLECSAHACQVAGADAMAAILKRFNSRMLIVSTQRYPDFDPSAYTSRFKLAAQTKDGVLLLLSQ